MRVGSWVIKQLEVFTKEKEWHIPHHHFMIPSVLVQSAFNKSLETKSQKNELSFWCIKYMLNVFHYVYKIKRFFCLGNSIACCRERRETSHRGRQHCSENLPFAKCFQLLGTLCEMVHGTACRYNRELVQCDQNWFWVSFAFFIGWLCWSRIQFSREKSWQRKSRVTKEKR